MEFRKFLHRDYTSFRRLESILSELVMVVFLIKPIQCMNRRNIVLLIGGLVSLAAAPLYGGEPIIPLPLSVEVDEAKARLGKSLFFDKRLSADNSISCASCHELSKFYGTDLKRTSVGIRGQLGGRNAPTVYNSTFNFTQFWDGRADSLASQALGPVTNPIEMGMSSWDEVVNKLKGDASYEKSFQAVYGAQMTAETIADAIAEFEKTLITSNSPFDKYLRGNLNAISPTQKRGYRLFKVLPLPSDVPRRRSGCGKN